MDDDAPPVAGLTDEVRDQPEHSPPITKTMQEIEAPLDAAIKRSLDEALQASGIKLSPPGEQAIVQHLSREVTIAFQQTISAYHGPFPPPQMMGEFDRAVPGLAKQIADMALAEQDHPHGWENKAQLNDIFMQSGALTLGWLLAGVCVVGAFVLGLQDKPVPMGILLSVSGLQMVRATCHGEQADER